MEVSGEEGQLVTAIHDEGGGQYFVKDRHKIMIALFLLMVVLVWLELT